MPTLLTSFSNSFEWEFLKCLYNFEEREKQRIKILYAEMLN